jgi:tetratricopeptide (TPR) repeat protein
MHASLGYGRATPPEQRPSYRGEHYASKGWEYYNDGDYPRALELFGYASRFADASDEAALGSAYCRLRLGDRAAALRLFEGLAGREYRLKDVLPNILALLVERGEHSRAYSYLNRLGWRERVGWQERIEKSIVERMFAAAQGSGDVYRMSAMNQTYGSELRECAMPGTFLETARGLLKNDRAAEAEEIYRGILSACTDRWDLRLAALYDLKEMLPFHEMQRLLDVEAHVAPDAGYLGKVMELKTHFLRESLAKAPAGSIEQRDAALALLETAPGDASARAILAWWHYDRAEYEDARALFSGLLSERPGDPDHAAGLAYTLMRLGRTDEALNAVEGAVDGRLVKIRNDLYLARAGLAYDNKDYAEAESYSARLLDADAANQDAMTILAWSLYNQGRRRDALPVFITLYGARKDPKIAEVIISIYDEGAGDASKFLSILPEGEASTREAIAGHYWKRGWAVLAAQSSEDPDACYHNADKPLSSASALMRSKSGDDGTSRLTETVLDLGYSHPFSNGRTIGFSVKAMELSSGDAPVAPFAGGFFRGSPAVSAIETDLTVLAPELWLEKEGETLYTLKAGLTPIGAELSPMPTFLAGMARGLFKLNLHQLPVEESMLSYAGLTDPYGTEAWGRVLRSGAEAEYTMSPVRFYWLTLKAGYDYYWGEGVEDNSAPYATTSFGKTYGVAKGDLSTGVFLTVKGFEKNSNFFTLGHGGYFSPELFAAVGPTVRYRLAPCSTIAFDGHASLQYLYYRTAGAAEYPLEDDPALETLVFEGDEFSGVGYSAGFKGLKLLSPYWAAGGAFDIDRSSDYTEWTGGLTIEYFIEPRGRLVPSDE